MSNASQEYVQSQMQMLEEKWQKKFEEAMASKDEEIKKMKEMNEQLASMYMPGTKAKRQVDQYKDKYGLRSKEANSEKPSIKMSEDNFAEYRQQITGWMKSLHSTVKKVMEELEKPAQRNLDEKEVKKMFSDEMREQAKQKYKIDIEEENEKEGRDVFEDEWYETVTGKISFLIVHSS